MEEMQSGRSRTESRWDPDVQYRCSMELPALPPTCLGFRQGLHMPFPTPHNALCCQWPHLYPAPPPMLQGAPQEHVS